MITEKKDLFNLPLIIGVLAAIVLVLWIIIFFDRHDNTNPAKGEGKRGSVTIFVKST